VSSLFSNLSLKEVDFQFNLIFNCFSQTDSNAVKGLELKKEDRIFNQNFLGTDYDLY
jgi:hypothetical protein